MNRIYRNYNRYHHMQNNTSSINSNIKERRNEPFSADMEKLVMQNNNLKYSLWTGDNLRVFVMNINSGENVEVERQCNVDMFFSIKSGNGMIYVGDNQNKLDCKMKLEKGMITVVPAGKWYNIVNNGNNSLKLISICAPVQC